MVNDQSSSVGAECRKHSAPTELQGGGATRSTNMPPLTGLPKRLLKSGVKTRHLTCPFFIPRTSDSRLRTPDLIFRRFVMKKFLTLSLAALLCAQGAAARQQPANSPQKPSGARPGGQQPAPQQQRAPRPVSPDLKDYGIEIAP